LLTANAKLFQAEQSWNRAKAMGPSDALSQNDYDMYRADFETAKAAVAVVEAQIAQAATGVAQAQASLNKAQRNLDFCTIKSPVKGVIIDRRVNIGQTVVSSLNAPSLFLIAKDLTRMQIWAAVNEADIGRIKTGTPVTFTCDAFPDRTFQGSVGKVRLNATMTQNVVMYTVEITTENPDNLLLPYLTANVRFEVQKEPGVLIVPNAALRWAPASANEIIPEARAAYAPVQEGAPTTKPAIPATAAKGRRGTIWLREGEFVRPIEVSINSTNGSMSAVSGESVKEDQELVVGEVAQTAEEAAKNPFLPQIRRR
jgi:HlyD family secretion protein